MSEPLAVVAIEPTGETGLNLHFSDGHARGIYPWSYLHELSLNHLQNPTP